MRKLFRRFGFDVARVKPAGTRATSEYRVYPLGIALGRWKGKTHWFNDETMWRPMSERLCLAVAGFGHSGSSAVVDYLSEFRGCVTACNQEFRLIKDFGGLSDLSVFWQGRQFQNSHLAVELFHQLFRQQYRIPPSRMFGIASPVGFGNGDHPDGILEDFIQALTLSDFPGVWIVNPFSRRGDSVLRALKYRIGKSRVRIMNPATDFDLIANNFLSDLRRDYIEDQNYEIAIYDQGVDPLDALNPGRWFSNLKSIVVVRDPRDQYLSWKHNFRGLYPTTPEDFCNLYRAGLEGLPQSGDSFLRVRFEDFVLDHQREAKRILSFADMSESDHLRPRWRFDPESSEQRVGKWKSSSDPDLKQIEEKLSNFCYPNN